MSPHKKLLHPLYAAIVPFIIIALIKSIMSASLPKSGSPSWIEFILEIPLVQFFTDPIIKSLKQVRLFKFAVDFIPSSSTFQTITNRAFSHLFRLLNFRNTISRILPQFQSRSHPRRLNAPPGTRVIAAPPPRTTPPSTNPTLIPDLHTIVNLSLSTVRLHPLTYHLFASRQTRDVVQRRLVGQQLQIGGGGSDVRVVDGEDTEGGERRAEKERRPVEEDNRKREEEGKRLAREEVNSLIGEVKVLREEVRRLTAIEAKRLADEARLRADEARLRAEDEAKRRAEDEAKRRFEVEVKRLTQELRHVHEREAAHLAEEEERRRVEAEERCRMAKRLEGTANDVFRFGGTVHGMDLALRESSKDLDATVASGVQKKLKIKKMGPRMAEKDEVFARMRFDIPKEDPFSTGLIKRDPTNTGGQVRRPDLPSLLQDIDPLAPGFTCIGTTKQGLRCRQSFISYQSKSLAHQRLQKMLSGDPGDSFELHRLQELADWCLCPRWHNSTNPHHRQDRKLAEEWYRKLTSSKALPVIQNNTGLISPPQTPPNDATYQSAHTTTFRE
ncbi:hypothetical protein EJ06DRAFT_389370 [Trichodelitschia bisporula]|uniref:Uncharacterized protein n=1 Tax=Trichodelitschia bisporula TaxID=703511 RepID=A0A6G1HZ93_9PEZI|nr:hypothetical protein EJ06DRAFT_389370 [Trichodelitschia bisporula]